MTCKRRTDMVNVRKCIDEIAIFRDYLFCVQLVI